MRSWLVGLVYTCVASAVACSDPVVPEAGDLVGRWVRAPTNLSPQGWHQAHLTFTAAGHFVHEVRTYGVYPGQRRDALSAFTRAEGVYRVDGDRLLFEPARLVWWDAFYGAASPVHVEEPYPWGGIFDDARHVVRGDRLTLRFTVYPADAPVPATSEYTRVY